MSVQKHESHNKGSKRKTITIINSIVNFAENLEKSLSRPSLFEFNSNSKKAFDDLDIYYIKSDNIYSLKTSLGSINLKPHQETSLYYMMGLEQQIYTVSYTNNKKIKTDIELLSDTCELETLHYTNIGLLCDKVGAGKTYTILSLIKEQKSLELVNMVTRDCNSGSSIINVVEPRKKLNTNILLVPHGLVAQWEDCCKKTNVKYYTISKAQDVYNLGENCLFAKHKK